MLEANVRFWHQGEVSCLGVIRPLYGSGPPRAPPRCRRMTQSNRLGDRRLAIRMSACRTKRKSAAPRDTSAKRRKADLREHRTDIVECPKAAIHTHLSKPSVAYDKYPSSRRI
jgi:hypothetical protein